MLDTVLNLLQVSSKIDNKLSSVSSLYFNIINLTLSLKNNK